jgi:2-hydroxychromene-2-carboxylate isomerase
MRAVMGPIHFHFDFVSPYSYLGWTQVHALAGRHARQVEPVPTLLAALLDARGARGPAEEPARRAYIIKNVARAAHRLGVPIELPPAHPFNPLLALRLASLPMAAETRRHLIDRLFAATWIEGRGVTDRAVVAGIVAAAGLPETALAEAESPEAKARLKGQTEAALAAGVFGVPTLIVDGELFFGVDSIPDVDRFLRGEDPVTPELLRRWAALPVGAERPRRAP